MIVLTKLIIGIVVLNFQIGLNLQVKGDEDESEDDQQDSSLMKTEKPKTTNVFPDILYISPSPFEEITDIYSSFHANFPLSHDLHTQYLSNLLAPVISSSYQIPNYSIENLDIEENKTSQNKSYLFLSSLVHVPSSSFNLLKQSSYLFKNSLNLLEESLSSVETLPAEAFAITPSTARFDMTTPILEKLYESNDSVETRSNIKETLTINHLAPSAESLVVSLPIKETPKLFSSLIEVTSSPMQKLKPSLSSIQVTTQIETSLKLVEVTKVKLDELGNKNSEKNRPTEKLIDAPSESKDDFHVESSILSSINDSSLKLSVINSTKNSSISELQNKILNFLNITSFQDISESAYLENKSRSEIREVDDIISGIIHLLAGNVKLARPVPNFFGPKPNHVQIPVPVASTRINNRGPISSVTFSRTVVVFSQPHNHLHAPTEVMRPPHLVPSAIHGTHLALPSDKTMHFIRLQPTKIGELPAPGVSVIRFYQPGKPPIDQHAPFMGEIFTPNNKPILPNLQLPNFPAAVVVPSFIDHLKMKNLKESLDATYPHFIFSDTSDSSVVVIVSSKPSVHQPVIFPTVTEKHAETLVKNAPTKTFEVLTDDINGDKKVSSTQNIDLVSENILENSIKKITDEIKPTTVSSPSSKEDEHAVPFGPITDWVPVFQLPQLNPSAIGINRTLVEDDDVSIIMQPIIFDLTVSHALNKLENSVNLTNENKVADSPSRPSMPDVPLKSVIEPSEINPTSLIFPSITLAPQLPNERSPPSADEEKSMKSSIIPIHYSSVHATPASTVKISLEDSKNKEILASPSLRIDMSPNILGNVLKTAPPHEIESSILEYYKPSVTKVSTFARKNTPMSNFIQPKSSETILSTTSRMSAWQPSSPNPQKFPQSTYPLSNIGPPYQAQQPLGHPIVIPVDIEEVRPMIGGINPINYDGSRPLQPLIKPGIPFPSTKPPVTQPSLKAVSKRPSPPTTTRKSIIRNPPRTKPNNIRIDTCIIGDDSTCAFNETCKMENGISSCHCRSGYYRSYTRKPCIPNISLMLSLKVDKIGDKKITYIPAYSDKHSEAFRNMEFEAKQALSSMMMHTAFSRNFLGLTVNSFYNIGERFLINCTMYLESKESTRTQAVRIRLRHEITESIRKNNQYIGDSKLRVEGPLSPLTAIEDVNECSDLDLNDCSDDAACFNVFGSFICKCRPGYADPFVEDNKRSGRKCAACSHDYCNYHGQCYVEADKKKCKCQGNYIGTRCEIDGEVLGVALGASVAAIIIILLTLGCLCIWNRKWKQQQQKTEMLSSRSYNSNQPFSYVNSAMMHPNVNPYQLTIEDRMRWAHISDVAKNVTVQPGVELPYLPSTCQDQGAYTHRSSNFHQPQNSDEELSWYEYRTRPRSRALTLSPVSPNPTCYDGHASSRHPYVGASYHKTYRHQNTLMRY